MQECENLLSLESKSCKMSICLEKSVSIKPRTDLLNVGQPPYSRFQSRGELHEALNPPRRPPSLAASGGARRQGAPRPRARGSRPRPARPRSDAPSRLRPGLGENLPSVTKWCHVCITIHLQKSVLTVGLFFLLENRTTSIHSFIRPMGAQRYIHIPPNMRAALLTKASISSIPFAPPSLGLFDPT